MSVCRGCGLRLAGDEESDGVGHLRSEQCVAALLAALTASRERKEEQP